MSKGARVWLPRILEYTYVVVWSTAIVALPITSFPLLKKWSGASTVAPPTMALFLLLALIWFVPYLLRCGKIPLEGRPLGYLIAAVGLSWALSCFYNIPSYRGKSVLTEGPSALLTFSMALAAYLIPAAYLSRKKEYIRLTLVLINISGAILLGWSLVQGVFTLLLESRYPPVMLAIQQFFSSRLGSLIWARVTGFAYEPSWLAHMLNMVYLPIWLASTFKKISVHRFRLWKVTIENVLLLAGIIVLFISISRVGVLSFLTVVAYLLVVWLLRLARQASDKLARNKPALLTSPTRLRWVRLGLSVLFLTLLVTVFLFSGMGLVVVGARYDPRLQRLLEYNLLEANSFYEATNMMAFAERVVYWAAGMDIFAGYPLLGVGLGNAGFYFPQKMPAYGWVLREVAVIFNYRPFLPNTKALWVRLLAETGLVGFGMMVAWLYVLWKSSKVTQSSSQPLLSMLGWSGQMVLISFITEGFSIDSFALPYFWFAMGLLSAAGMLVREDSHR